MTTCIFTDSDDATRAATAAREANISAAVEVHSQAEQEKPESLFGIATEGAFRHQLERVLAKQATGSSGKPLAESAIRCPRCHSIWVTVLAPGQAAAMKGKFRRLLSNLFRRPEPSPEPQLRCDNCGKKWAVAPND